MDIEKLQEALSPLGFTVSEEVDEDGPFWSWEHAPTNNGGISSDSPLEAWQCAARYASTMYALDQEIHDFATRTVVTLSFPNDFWNKIQLNREYAYETDEEIVMRLAGEAFRENPFLKGVKAQLPEDHPFFDNCRDNESTDVFTVYEVNDSGDRSVGIFPWSGFICEPAGLLKKLLEDDRVFKILEELRGQND